MNVVWSGRALQRLKHIAEYIARDAPATARQFTHSLREDIESLLSEFPRAGKEVLELNDPNLREHIYRKNYRVIYRTKTDQVHILTIVHTRQLNF